MVAIKFVFLTRGFPNVFTHTHTRTELLTYLSGVETGTHTYSTNTNVTHAQLFQNNIDMEHILYTE